MAEPALPLGLGTGVVDDRAACVRTVRRALEAGYRHVDTAAGYDNEAYVGEAVARASVPREDVLVATKVLQHDLAYDDVVESVHRSRERLGVETIDLLYVHWPTHEYDPERTLAAFDAVHERGLVDRIGVCNFTFEQLRTARDRLAAPLSAYQVEHHPLFRPSGLVAYCHREGIPVVGYSPLADGRALTVPAVQAVARRRDATPAQVCLAWSLAHGVTPIPKGSGEHLSENLAARSVTLSDDDVARIDAVERTERVYDPPWAPWN